MPKEKLEFPRPVRPADVTPQMIDDGVLYYRHNGGLMSKVLEVRPVQIPQTAEAGVPLLVKIGYWVRHEEGSMFTNALGEDDTPLFLEQMPQVGMGATLVYPDDRYPYTVIEVLDANTIVVQEDLVDHQSGNFRAGNVKWTSTPSPLGTTYTIKYREGRGWRCEELLFTVGSRDYYMSPEI